MEFVLSLLLQTALVPVVVSVVVVTTMNRIPRLVTASAAVAPGIAFFAGWAMQEWTTLQPVRYIDWCPYVALALGSIVLAIAAGLPQKMMWPLVVATCIAAAWLLVPNFPRLKPPRPQAIGLVAVTSILFVAATRPIAGRFSPRFLTACLMATGTAASVVLAQSFSLKFAQLMGILTAGLAGNLFYVKRSSDSSFVWMSLVFMPILINLMFIGYAGSPSQVPILCYAILPCAPIMMWTSIFFQREDTPSPKELTVALVAVGVVLLIAVYPAVMAHPPWASE
ncbi:MAG: hypothetical protein MK110_17490 [Fuerstiella sp.]|nr:hypothetical protein [Fuerstiella sp.]